MSNRKGDVDLRLAHLRPQLTLWLGFNSSHTSHLPAYEDVTDCSKTSAYTIQTPRNYPEASIQLFEEFVRLQN